VCDWLSSADLLVLLLLSQHPTHQPSVEEVLLRSLTTTTFPFPLLHQLLQHTTDEAWSRLSRPLLDLAIWLLLLTTTTTTTTTGISSSTLLLLHHSPWRLLEVRSQVGHLLCQLFLLHPRLRDQIISLLLSLCLPGGGGGGGGSTSSTNMGKEEKEEEESGVMRAASQILHQLSRTCPQALLPYAGE